MKKGLCNFCIKELLTYRCKVLGMTYIFHACADCISKLGLIPMEEINEYPTKQESEEE